MNTTVPPPSMHSSSPATRRTTALASLVAGLMSVIFVPFIGVPFGIVEIVQGYFGKRAPN